MCDSERATDSPAQKKSANEREKKKKIEDRYIEKSKGKKTPPVKDVRGVSGDRGKA